MPINSDKPQLWKADVSASVDLYNSWFLATAPETFRESTAKSTERVRSAFMQTDDLRSITAATLEQSPAVLSTLRMSTAPPIARDRLIGLAAVSSTVVKRMEEGSMPVRQPLLFLVHFNLLAGQGVPGLTIDCVHAYDILASHGGDGTV